MNTTSPILLIGVGGGGCAIASGVNRAFGGNLRYLLADTDAKTGEGGEPFMLMGGERLSGRGSGGDIVSARMAAEDSIIALKDSLEGVRLAVVATSLGGGTGGGGTLEVTKRLAELGVPTVVFATTPFTFEGEDRQRNARGVMAMIEEAANATFFIPLDKLVGEIDNMDEALKHAIGTLASAITLFWRLIEKPGYLKLDVERLRHLLSRSGRGRFATVTVQGPSRAEEAIDAIIRSPLLSAGTSPVRAILCGILAGEDLRLSEIGRIADGIHSAFGERAAFELATVNDEQTFTGRISVVAMLFESGGREEDETSTGAVKGNRRAKRSILSVAPTGRGRFNNAEPTVWHGEDLDIPTFLRQNISLDF